MGVVRKQAGAQSASFLVTPTPDGESFITEFYLNNTQWSALPSGKLKDLLNTTYTKIVDDVVVVDPLAFTTAYAEAGAFQVTSSYDTTEVEDSYWSLAGVPALPSDPPLGTPVLFVYAAEFGTAARVSCSYSASE